MKKLSSLILTTCVLLGSGLAWKTMPAFSGEMHMGNYSKGVVKAEAEISPDTLAQKLNLTPEQKLKAAKILADSNKKIFQILNPTQQKKVEAALKEKKALGPTIQSLDLSLDQKRKIGAILFERKNQFLALLTPEQKQKLQTLYGGKK